MNAVEEIIKEKLRTAFEAEKRRVASNLLVPFQVPKPVHEDTVIGGIAKSTIKTQPALKIKSVHVKPITVTSRRAKKTMHLQKLQKSLTDATKKQSTSKNPEAARDKVTILRQKVALARAELAAIHDDQQKR